MMGLNKLRAVCDTTIVVPNDKLLELVPRDCPVEAAFKVADEVLMPDDFKGLTEIITKPGLVNLDYADIQTVMKEGGVAFVGIGEANTDEDDRVKAAVHEAISSPLLGDIDLKDAKGALIRIVGGPDMTISEAQRAAEIVTSSVNERARIIWGCSIDPEMGTIKILVIVTGAGSKYMYGKGGATTTKMALQIYQQKRIGSSAPPTGEPSRSQKQAPIDDDGIDLVG